MNNLIKEVLTSYLKTNNNVIFGYLYGSCSKNSQTNTSDIDIALYLNVICDEVLSKLDDIKN